MKSNINVFTFEFNSPFDQTKVPFYDHWNTVVAIKAVLKDWEQNILFETHITPKKIERPSNKMLETEISHRANSVQNMVSRALPYALWAYENSINNDYEWDDLKFTQAQEALLSKVANISLIATIN